MTPDQEKVSKAIQAFVDSGMSVDDVANGIFMGMPGSCFVYIHTPSSYARLLKVESVSEDEAGVISDMLLDNDYVHQKINEAIQYEWDEMQSSEPDQSLEDDQ